MLLSENRHIHRLDQVTNVLLAMILGIPFLISAGALADMARQHGVSTPWLYPFMVDGGLIIFKALALRASLHGRRDTYAWLMAAVLTIISVILNVLHVPADVHDKLLATLMAALPPLVILTAFIAVSRRVEETTREASAVITYDKLLADMTAKRAEFDNLEAELNARFDNLRADRLAEMATLTADMERLKAQKAALTIEIQHLSQEKLTAVADNGLSPFNGTAMTARNGNSGPLALPTSSALTSFAVNGREEMTPRQQQILSLLQQGLDKVDIAMRLGVSERTVYRDIQAMGWHDH